MERGARVGRWVVERELGRGGMGVVLEATPAAGGASVALKLVRLDPRDPAGAARAEREARALFAVRHPNIAAVLDVQVTPDRLLIATELVRGESLHARVTRDGPLAPAEASSLGREVALALEAAHAEGVVHRDVTPRNVLFGQDGGVKLIDFGLARLASPGEERLTTTGEVLGTPAFMAPEQADGRAHEADARADVYGLGATLYWALTGRAPFSAPTALGVLEQVLARAPDPPRRHRPGLPRSLERAVLRCLAKDPAARPAAAAEVAELLREGAPRARPWALAAIGAIGGAMAAAGLAAASLARPPAGRADPPGPVALVSSAGPQAGPPLAVAAVATAEGGGADPDLAAAEEVVDLALRGDLAGARARAEGLRGAGSTRRGALIRTVLRRLDVPPAPLLDGVAASLVELRLAARELEATGAERAALRTRLAALAFGEADPDELARLGTQAARCRAPPPLALLERGCAAHPRDGALALARLAALWLSRSAPRPVDEVAAGLEGLPPGAPAAARDLLAARVAVARAEVDRALALLAAPDRAPEAAIDRGALLHVAGRRDEARAELAAGISADPTAPMLRVVRVLAGREGAYYSDPLEDLQAALAADPWHADALDLCGKLSLRRGDDERATACLTELVRVATRDKLLDALRIAFGFDPLRAAAAGERLTRRGADLPLPLEQVRRGLEAATPGPKRRGLARAAVRAGAGETALRLLDDLAAKGEALPEDADLRLLVHAGLLLRMDEAAEAAAQAVARWPQAAAPLAARAMVDLLRGHVEEGRRGVDEALRLDPDDARALHARARLRLLDRDPAGALADLRAAGAAAPEDPWIGADLGGALQEAGRPDEAAGVLRRAREAAPGWWRAFYLEALGEQAAARPGRASILLGAALLANDRPAAVWVLRARARVALGDPLGALEDLEAAAARESPPSLDWRATAVDARLLSGDVAGALEVVEAAPAEQRARLVALCEPFARRAWWTEAERDRLSRLLAAAR